MKSVTTAYRNAMNEQIRPEGYVRITVYNGSTSYVFNRADITSCEKNHSADMLSAVLPTEQFTFSVLDPSGTFDPRNPSGQWAALSEKTKVKVEWGLKASASVTYLTADWYYLNDRPTYNDMVATFTASSVLCHLTMQDNADICGFGQPTETTAKAMLSAFANASGKVTAGEIAVFADSILNSIYFSPFGLKHVSARECIQQTMNALGGMFFTTGTTVNFRLFNPKATNASQYTLTRKDILYDGVTVELKNTISEIDVNEYNFSLDAPTAVIFERTFDVSDGLTVRCEYDSQYCYPGSIAVPIVTKNFGDSGLTWTSKQSLHGIEYTFSGGSGNVTVSVESLTMKVESQTLKRSYGSTDGVTETGNNALITNKSLNSLCAAQIKNWKSATKYTVLTRGNPEIEVGDIVTLTLGSTSQTVKCVVLGNVIGFDGGFAGKMTLLAIPSASILAAPTLAKQDLAHPNIVTVSHVPFENGYNFYVDGIWKESVYPGNTFNIDNYVSDTKQHVVTAKTYGSNGETYSENSNSVLASGSANIKYATPQLNFMESQGGQRVDITNVEAGVEQFDVYVDGRLLKTVNTKKLFTIMGTVYYYELGMFWLEWVTSAYNTGGYTISAITPGGKVTKNGNYVAYMDGNPVDVAEPINGTSFWHFSL